MYLIRQFEKKVEEYFTRGLLRGTTHGCTGQEAIAVGILEWVNLDEDFVTGNHRSHGHFLALTEDVFGLASELMGRVTGVVHGLGGSQHLQFKNFYSNGITGGMIPVAVGLGLAKNLKKETGAVISFLGDGAMNEGYVMEALNLSAVLQTPNIFVLENNYYAMSTPINNVTANLFADRVKGLGLNYKKIQVLDVMEIYEDFGQIYRDVSEQHRPYFLECETFRFCGHSKNDQREYIDRGLEEYWLQNDPLLRARNQLSLDKILRIEQDIDQYLEECFLEASSKPEPKSKLLMNC